MVTVKPLQSSNHFKMKLNYFISMCFNFLLRFLEMIEDGPSGTEILDCQLFAPPSNSTHVNQEKDPFKKLGLTKEVLAVHTQKEEQSFLNKFKEIKKFHTFQNRCNYYLHDRPKGCPGEHGKATDAVLEGSLLD